MSDLFDAFESGTSNANFFDSTADPAAEFLAREQAELAKIENNDFLNENQTINQFSGLKLESQENGFEGFGKKKNFPANVFTFHANRFLKMATILAIILAMILVNQALIRLVKRQSKKA